MSGFDDNPFGKPTEPFADPAIQQVTRNVNVQQGLDDYNPFAENGSLVGVRGGGANPPPYQPGMIPAAEPAIMQPTHESPAPPAYAKSGQQMQQPQLQQPQQFSTSEFQRRQEELERKAEELARREEELKSGQYNARRNNWPPVPEKCCFQPCFYQDINVDIPLEFQKVVRMLYYLWMFHGCIMILNLLGGLVLIFTDQDFNIFGLSLLYLILFTPFSFVCWFRPAYKAFRNDSSFNFMVFFFVFFFQFVVSVIQAMGIPSCGTCGLLVAINMFKESIVVGIMLLIIALGFCAAACMDILLLSKIHRIYRSTGASFAKAQQEFTSEFLRNEHVQTAASNAAAATVRAHLSSSRY